eukprot:EG_transcript_14074
MSRAVLLRAHSERDCDVRGGKAPREAPKSLASRPSALSLLTERYRAMAIPLDSDSQPETERPAAAASAASQWDAALWADWAAPVATPAAGSAADLEAASQSVDHERILKQLDEEIFDWKSRCDFANARYYQMAGQFTETQRARMARDEQQASAYSWRKAEELGEEQTAAELARQAQEQLDAEKARQQQQQQREVADMEAQLAALEHRLQRQKDASLVAVRELERTEALRREAEAARALEQLKRQRLRKEEGRRRWLEMRLERSSAALSALEEEEQGGREGLGEEGVAALVALLATAQEAVQAQQDAEDEASIVARWPHLKGTAEMEEALMQEQQRIMDHILALGRRRVATAPAAGTDAGDVGADL